MKTIDQFEIYSQGICCMSVCTSLKDVKKIEERANNEAPTGVQSRWKVSKEAFKTGQSNPCPCEVLKTHQHFLLEC